MNIRRLLAAGSALAGILAVGVVAAASATPGDAGRTAAIAEGDAIAVVRAAVGDAPDLKVTATIGSPTSRGYVVSGAKVDAIVDVATGRLGMLALTEAAPTSAEVRLSPDEALTAAVASADALGVRLPKALPAVELVDHGSTVEYVASWVREVNGVRVPDQLVVKVNAETGRVFSVVRIDRPFTVPEMPRLSKSEATQVSDRVVGASPHDILGAHLAVVFDGDGAQRTVWRLSYRVEDDAGSYYGSLFLVDANSGELVELP